MTVTASPPIKTYLLSELARARVISEVKAAELGNVSAADFEIKSLRGLDLVRRAAKTFGFKLDIRELKKTPKILKSFRSVENYVRDKSVTANKRNQ